MRFILKRVSIILLSFLPLLTLAEVSRVEIIERFDLPSSVPTGKYGVYEQLNGKIYFTFDPANKYNSRIVDLSLAPTNADGLVEAWANFTVLQPKDASLRRKLAFVEVSNRGGKASLRYFNAAKSGTRLPREAEHYGDGLLMRQGLTVIWVGWQYDVPEMEGNLRLYVPSAGEDVEGWVRADWVIDRSIKSLHLGHRGNKSYPVASAADERNVLTVRHGRLAERNVIPAVKWRLGQIDDDGNFTADPNWITLEGGFQEGKIYELVYRAVDPKIVGLGLAVIRDIISYAKYDKTTPFPVEMGIAFGVSQTGRFLRHFLYQGFNTDEEGRMAYDGMLIHSAGAGRGSFNHRFAQASRDAHRYSAFFYPTDIFPFSGAAQLDQQTGVSDGLYNHLWKDTHLPKIFYTNTGYEYWGRAASLLHTSVDGKSDIPLQAYERIYHLSSGQHFVEGFPPRDRWKHPDTEAYRGNPLDFLVTLRAQLVNLNAWVADGMEPPESKYPTIAEGKLVPLAQYQFPKIPNLETPSVTHEAYRVDYGPRWADGIIDIQPPELGEAYPILISQVDEDGNEIAGVPTVESMVPLATYTPWNLRWGFTGSPDELTNFRGTFIPFALTKVAAESTGDPRQPVEARYRSRKVYLQKVSKAAKSLVKQRLLLKEDRKRVMVRAEEMWDWLHR